jgi:hypothetical protein
MRVLPQRIRDPFLDLASVPAPAGAAAFASSSFAVPAAPEERVTARSPHETKRITRPFALCIHAQGARRYIVGFGHLVALLLRPARVSLTAPSFVSAQSSAARSVAAEFAWESAAELVPEAVAAGA